MYLLDSNIVPELRKPRRNPNVVRWISTAPADALYLSVITIGEIAKGIAKQRHAGTATAAANADARTPEFRPRGIRLRPRQTKLRGRQMKLRGTRSGASSYGRFKEKLERRLGETDARLGRFEEKFERRLADTRAELRVEIQSVRGELIKWAFVFWVPVVLALIGLYLKV